MHVMLDTETLAQSPRSSVISIGACTFDVNGIHDTFKVNIKPESCKEYGLEVSKSTLEWWANQPKEVREATLEKNVQLDFGLRALSTWLNTHRPTHYWAHGVAFDYPILENAYNAVGIDIPWKYWQVMDTRTIFNMFGVSTKDLHEKANSAHHDALNDVKVQANAAVEILKAMGWGDKEGPLVI